MPLIISPHTQDVCVPVSSTNSCLGNNSPLAQSEVILPGLNVPKIQEDMPCSSSGVASLTAFLNGSTYATFHSRVRVEEKDRKKLYTY